MTTTTTTGPAEQAEPPGAAELRERIDATIRTVRRAGQAERFALHALRYRAQARLAARFWDDRDARMAVALERVRDQAARLLPVTVAAAREPEDVAPIVGQLVDQIVGTGTAAADQERRADEAERRAERAEQAAADARHQARALERMLREALTGPEGVRVRGEANLWALWDPARDDGTVPAVSEGYMAELLGVDRLTLRGMYADFLAREQAPTAIDVYIRRARGRLALRLAQLAGWPE